MRSIGFWASLALLVTVAAAQNCGQPCGQPYGQPYGNHDAVSAGPEIVTYGEPCYCKESYPYAIQVPVIESQSHSKPVEKLRSYGYSVETPSVASPSCSQQFPIKIETPIVQRRQGSGSGSGSGSDQLRGRSYGVTVERERQSFVSPNYSFDVAIQRPAVIPAVVTKVSEKLLQPLEYQVEHYQEKCASQHASLPVAIQIPVRSGSSDSESQTSETRLVGLTSRVDRILVPACECNDCPDCADVQRVY